MSEPVAPLGTAEEIEEQILSETPLIAIEETGLRGMITLRGDLSSDALQAAVDEAVGLSIPSPLSMIANESDRAVWMSPDELLLFCDYADVNAAVARVSEQLFGAHHMALNVSDARAVIRLTGKRVGEVLAKGAPCDCSDHGFPVGMARRTHLAGLAVAFWRLEQDVWEIVALRSYAHHLMTWLETASVTGSEVWTD